MLSGGEMRQKKKSIKREKKITTLLFKLVLFNGFIITMKKNLWYKLYLYISSEMSIINKSFMTYLLLQKQENAKRAITVEFRNSTDRNRKEEWSKEDRRLANAMAAKEHRAAMRNQMDQEAADVAARRQVRLH